ncbi:hypothetical protein KAR91_16340, partial [Candidatus Pacearchaeota archaeon]|nr:hypothetical protein [Candidatus Pacearchaeota archaeon]
MAEEIYDFTSGRGVDKWCYDIESDTYTTPEVPGSSVQEIILTNGEYDLIESSNDSRFSTLDPSAGNFSGLSYKCEINQVIGNITQIDFLMEGLRHAAYYVKLWVYNHNTTLWELLSETESDTVDKDFTGQKTSGFANYIDGSGFLWFLFLYNRPQYHFDVDYIKITVTYTAVNYKIEGKTFDKDGDALGTCKCLLLKDNQDDTATVKDYTTSDGSGDYSFENIADDDAQYQVYAWKDDSPHVMDVTDHVLLPKVTPDTDYDLYLRSDVDKGETSPDKDLRLRADEDKIGDITGTSAIVIEEITVSGAGQQIFEATSVITLDEISVSAGGSLEHVGQSVITLEEITVAAAGLYEFIATSAIVLDEIT